MPGFEERFCVFVDALIWMLYLCHVGSSPFNWPSMLLSAYTGKSDERHISGTPVFRINPQVAALHVHQVSNF